MKHNRWTKGPVFSLDAEVVAADSERIWRSMAKLVKTLKITAPLTVRVAEAALTKVRVVLSMLLAFLLSDALSFLGQARKSPP